MADANANQLIICTFDDPEKAGVAKRAVELLDEQLDVVELGNIAIVSKNADGSIVFHETKDHRDTLGNVVGSVVSGVTWLVYNFAGMMGPVAGNAAGMDAKLTVERFARDTGFPDAALQDIGAKLDAGHSALIVLVNRDDTSSVVEQLKDLGGQIITHEIPAELMARLAGGVGKTAE
jgi:uncharacterized membrane protein